ncbi:MAG: TlpA disulfide reductase family protein, partial [Bacteroidota bacterium]|nr:TlpA disulfide reductase family protein [Bacteroidota bacterium]
DNPITQHYRTIATCLVSASGNFETEFEADSTLLINISLDANNGFFYAEPGKTYQILLPPLRKKTIREQRSPFFRQSLVHLNILHSDSLELNNLIAILDSTFSSALQKNLNAIFQNHSRVHAQMIDSLIDHIGRSNTTPFLKDYKQYKKAYIGCMLQSQATSGNIRRFLSQNSVLINNPAYLEVFDLLSREYLRSISTKRGDKPIEQLIGEGDFTALRDRLTGQQGFSQEVAELFLLQNLYDGYYSKDYSTEGILRVIKSMTTKSSSPLLCKLSEGVYQKITWLSAGSPAPSFSLTDQFGKLRTLADFKGKFVYLNFVATDDYSCQEHFKAFLPLSANFAKDLAIVSLAIDADFSKANNFFHSKNYSWTLLNAADSSELLKIYNVKSFPQYVLIDREGKIVNSQALSPYEDFQSQFSSLLQTEHIKQLREQSK